jgi:hypothetical protein
MQRLFPLLMVVSPFLLLAACGDGNLREKGEDGGGGAGAPPDVPLDGLVTYDGVSCQAPRVWGYQEPGCGADAHPVCAHAVQDACLRYACGCDGEILEGCDYYSKPWRSAGLCPDACFSPTRNLQYASYPQIKGCACDPASDVPQCIQGRGLLACVGGAWTLDPSKNCAALDAGSDGQVTLDASADEAVAPGCDVGVARAAMAARGLVVTGSAETHNETLPSPISGPNWGLKSIACKDGGYDITLLAGQTVCLVKQTIVQACAKAPYLAWAVMSAGSVQCLYKTDDTTPGVYAVNAGYVCP